MNSYQDWAACHPKAAADLAQVLNGFPKNEDNKKSEAWVQQQQRFKIAHSGAYAWRNNVGATPAKTQHTCPRCSMRFEEKQQPVRYGWMNDSAQLNAKLKSPDLLLAIPRLITSDMVGQTIAQIGGMEIKQPGWKFTGKGREGPQAAALALINRIGGFACFSTCDVDISKAAFISK